MDSTASAYKDLLPGNFNSMFRSSFSFNYGDSAENNRMAELQMYNAALNLYGHILSKLSKSDTNNKSDRGAFYHWSPSVTPYCTQLIDWHSGRRVTVAKSRAGTTLSGYHNDIEANFGRGMGSEAVKMMYDGKLHDEISRKAA